MKFNFVFSSLLAIALTSGVTAVSIGTQPNINPEQKQIVSACTYSFRITIRALTGLVGGLNLSNNKKNRDD
jgi:hypothetical protein